MNIPRVYKHANLGLISKLCYSLLPKLNIRSFTCLRCHDPFRIKVNKESMTKFVLPVKKKCDANIRMCFTNKAVDTLNLFVYLNCKG